ncbi:MAG: CDP-alcohol phosphatidyltransferase family protein [Alistipes sp.]|nr:CDP-alcohol phosphatidyltransferase family protein [Alistipes sp.]
MKIRLFTLPNFITLGNLFCGAMATVSALVYDDLTMAFYWVVLAAVCDFFDGMVARMMGLSGPLGVQLDSLADDISFGLAPSAILFTLFNRVNDGVLPNWVGFVCFIFAAFAALRLAKFNIDEEQHTEFRGLPTPAATLYVVALGWSVEHSGIMAGVNVWGVLVTTLVLALVMVSNLPMFSLKFKGFGWKGNELRYLFMVFSLALLLMFGVESVLLIIGTYIATSATLAAINSSKS